VRDRAGRLLRARTELGFELGRDPGAAKLARYLDWETAEVAEVLSLPADADSLGRPLMLPQGDSSLVGDLVRNPHAEDPSDRASLRAELSRLRSEIRRLHSRQREALTLRHGLGERSGEAGTMREMGEAMGVCAATTANDAERVLMVLRDHLAPPGVR
jgi:DNA-directed RNA polymerase sigma subunit (sigma70/sigma32)